MLAATLVTKTFSRWSDHEGQRLGAALAFYTLLSAAPLLVFVLLALSGFYGTEAVEQTIATAVRTMIGPTAAEVVRSFLDSARRPSHSTLAGFIAVGTLIFGASAAFAELREDLNKMWDARPRNKGLFGLVVQRAFAFFLVLASGVLLFAVMLVSTAVTFITRHFKDLVPVSPVLLTVANSFLSFALLTLIFVLIYRFVPDRVLPWRVLWTGAPVSALLLVIGKTLLGWYLAKAGVGSAYGIAGSLIAIAFWLYYSAQIFLLGAEFTYVWALRPKAA